MADSNFSIVSIPNLSLEELKRKAINFYNDRGTNWKLFGCDAFAAYNYDAKTEIDEFAAPEWVPATFKSDSVLINRICVNYLCHHFTFGEDGFVTLAKKIGVMKTLDIIDRVAATKIFDQYPTLKPSNPSKVKEGVCEPVK